MTIDRDAIRRFFRLYEVSPVGASPVQPNIPPEEETDAKETVDLTVEITPEAWKPMIVPESPAREREFPTRFIDGSQTGQPVLCVRSPLGWPIPLMLSEVGAVALKSVGRGFEREFVAVERVLSFVADPFPWEEVEAFADCLLNKPELKLRVLPANRPPETHNPFDYEIMRMQARARAQQEMTTLERLAVAVDPSAPTLVDGPLNRIMSSPDPCSELRVGVAKQQAANYLHECGWRALLNLRAGCRTPVFHYESKGADRGQFPVASWFLKLAGGPRLAPNWGYVRVEVPWGQFLQRVDVEQKEFGFVDRLSRWLIHARCRTDSYTRMPVSLDPIVRAEEALKPLFTPTHVLVNRLYRTAGLFRGDEL
jgi:hypothetical protein